jgi:hypothetical protein
MALITVVIGAALIAVGLAGYEATDRVSWTALIPAIIGAVLATLGGLSFKDRLRKHAMHAAALVASLSVLFTVSGVVALGIHLMGHQLVNKEGRPIGPAAAISRSVTCGLCALFVVLCINSFVQARRRRRAAEAGPAEAGATSPPNPLP